MYELLKTIQSPSDLRALERKQLPELARQLREFLLESVAGTGEIGRASCRERV